MERPPVLPRHSLSSPATSAADRRSGPYQPPLLATPASLPVHLTTFVGRGHEIGIAARLLRESRLVTLTGAGGSGKTRLAHEAATRAASEGREVAWVELAPVHDPALIDEVVLATLGTSDQGGRVAADVLLDLLRHRELLIVIDNCEHLADAAGALIDRILRACPGVSVLATSRQALSVEGEVAWLVPPLSLPSTGADPHQSEAVQLFVERARAVVPTFEMTESNAPAVVEICRRLDGLPLALELAAARLRVLGAEQIAARLSDRFRLLTAASRTAVPRHQTLRAAIDWSYDLLNANEKLLLERSSIFGGSFSLEAAEQICSGDAIAADDVLDLLAALVERSLVEMLESAGTARYRQLETVRQYGIERLVHCGGSESVAAKHAAYFTSLAVESDPHLMTTRRREWMAKLEPELDNLRQALDWSGESDPRLQLRLAGSLRWFWFSTGLWVEGMRWLEAALTNPVNADRNRDRGVALHGFGMLAALQGRAEIAVPALGEALPIARECGDARLGAYILNYTGFAHAVTSLPDLAEGFVKRAAEWFETNEDLYGLRLACLIMGTVYVQLDRLEDAVQSAERGLEVAQAFGQARELAISQQMLGFALLVRGDDAGAMRWFRESLASSLADPQPLFISRSLDLLAATFLELGELEGAAQAFGAAEAVRERIGARRYPIDRKLLEPRIASLSERLGAGRLGVAWEAGKSSDTGAAIDAAIALADSLMSATGVEMRQSAECSQPQRESPALCIRALGGLAIEIDGAPVAAERWRYTKPRELLMILASHPEGRTKEQIGVLLWPDASAAQVRNNFHVTLHHLRKVLGRGECVRFERNRYMLDPGLTLSVDASSFESTATGALRAVRRGEAAVEGLRAAAALYRGRFLDGEPFGDWHIETAERLERIHADVVEALAAQLAGNGATAEAIELARGLLARDPLRESAARVLIEALGAAGERGEALVVYRSLEKLLESELGSRPAPETQRLIERVMG